MKDDCEDASNELMLVDEEEVRIPQFSIFAPVARQKGIESMHLLFVLRLAQMAMPSIQTNGLAGAIRNGGVLLPLNSR